MTKPQNLSEDQLDLMHYIQHNVNISQRQISKKTGFSVGKVNYCLKALKDIGFIKIHKFNKSTQKKNYTYILTPKGIKEKANITMQFIAKKKQEYDKFTSYIDL